MNEMALQLKELIKINRKIINQLHKDEADIELLRKRFDERGKQTKKLTEIADQFDNSTVSLQEKEMLQKLFERFDQQASTIQSTLDYILEESKERLNEAIKRNKAEKSYRLLNR